MRGHLLALVLVAAVIASWPARAETTPVPGLVDPRIRTVTYNANNVVAIDASYGISTMIVLGDAEHIETIAVGDSLAWRVEPNKHGNIIFLKPVAPHAATDMNVVTDQRLYTFSLRSHEQQPGKAEVYKVKFSYPGEDEDKRLVKEAQALVNDPNRRAFKVKHANTDYGFKGDVALKPVAVFDDGVKTWFQFGGEVPAIFIVDKDRHESLVNYRREKSFLVVDKVNRQWTLRSGELATCIFNLRPSKPDPTGMEPFGPQKLTKTATGHAAIER